MPDLRRGIPNLLTLWLRRYGWRFHPARFMALSDTPIERPIFLLGLQGGGLTLLARMLRRNPNIVTVTGNHTYWAGPDEMQNVMGAILPGALSGLHANIPDHPSYPLRDWLYATDELLPLYRRTAKEATPEIKRQLQHAIRLALKLHAVEGRPARFLDKSQSFTVRLGFVQELLKEHDPYFLLVTRNPYALCLRSALRVKSLTALDLPVPQRLELAAQQWANSISCALEDAPAIPRFYQMRFEDLLLQPEATLQAVCEFAGLSFSEDMLPQAHHQLPRGATGSSRGDQKWFPLRPDVNASYLRRLDEPLTAIIRNRCGDLSERFGYMPEGTRRMEARG